MRSPTPLTAILQWLIPAPIRGPLSGAIFPSTFVVLFIPPCPQMSHPSCHTGGMEIENYDRFSARRLVSTVNFPSFNSGGGFPLLPGTKLMKLSRGICV